MAKQSIASIMPRFNMQRMLSDYARKFYSPAAEQWRKYSANGFSGAGRVADWKARIRAAWPSISLRRIDHAATRIRYGETLRFEIAVQLDGLTPGDLAVEMVFTRPGELRKAEWASFDLDKSEWRYFINKTKTEHLVPLSVQAVVILRELHALTGDGRFVFPSARGNDRPMSDAAVNAALRLSLIHI